jgi:Fur family peroxide stress response transcriptional regulator
MERKSKKREAIRRALCSTKEHPCAEWIYSRLKNEIPDLSLGTVYANLAAFKENGSAICVGVVDGKERFDGDTAPHVHFICRECGTVDDVRGASIPKNPKLPGRVDYCQLSYFGVCQKCKSKKQGSTGTVTCVQKVRSNKV